MRQCYYCERWFRNKQAVRAHLKRCYPYIEAKSEEYEFEDETESRTRKRPIMLYECKECGFMVSEGEATICPRCGGRVWI